MPLIPLRIGVSDSDRMRPLLDRQVTIAGVEPTIELMPVQALFNRQLTEHVFDCCEFPLTSYLRTLEAAAKPYLAVPVFPSRHFRLSCVFVHTGSGVCKPADLAGKRVGIPVFDMAAAVWLRGIFEEHYGLARTAPIYVSGGLEEARRGEEHPQFYPAKFAIERVTDQGLAALLGCGGIDALYTARAPSTWPSAKVQRLFADPIAAELAYYERTGIFPPMHIIAVKRPLAERYPDLARSLFDAFAAAQRLAQAKLADSSALSAMLPWLLEHVQFTEQKLGGDYWPVGFAKNRATLEVVIRYMLDDGLIKTTFTPEDLFAGAESLLAT
jgi:4,5-dihydroxyphthalate decarboxylase